MKHKEAWTVGDEGIRTLGKPNHCFYCGVERGGIHKDDCVIRQRTVIVRMTVEYAVLVPESWTKEEIEFDRNLGRWCATNAISELEDISHTDCLCDVSKFEFVREATEDDEEKFGVYVSKEKG